MKCNSKKTRIEDLENTIDELVTLNEHSNHEGTPNDDTAVLSGPPNEHQVVKNFVRRGVRPNRQAELGTEVAFLATTGSHNVHSGQNQPLIFERVVTDIGNAHNPHFGTFIAPIDGVYSFSVTLLSESGFISHYYIYKNNTAICHLTLYHPSSETYTSMSQIAVLQLKKGDDVSVRNQDADKTTYGDNYSTFSGFILWKTHDNPEVVGKK
ncbi:complement C1q-like protein 3 [Mya arenaria]|uniref:complement C1q-like protein 3 n=1 Tax=Mya arenaria TaxID=6604 RepID=UPI0022E57931|nr:complement C1q-like protein 3 [Mya arenaria]